MPHYPLGWPSITHSDIVTRLRVRDLKLQRWLLARTDVTLQLAIDEAWASELSNRSSSEILKAISPTVARKAAAVHYDNVESDLSSDEEEVSRLKAVPKKKWDAEQQRAQGSCAGCGGNHNRSACRFRNAECRHCGRKGHLAKVCQASLPTVNNPTRVNKSLTARMASFP